MTSPTADGLRMDSPGVVATEALPARAFLRSVLMEQSGLSAEEAAIVADAAAVQQVSWASVELLPFWRALTDIKLKLPRQPGRSQAEGHTKLKEKVLEAFRTGVPDPFAPMPSVAGHATHRVGEIATSDCGECAGNGKSRCDACRGVGAFTCRPCGELGRLPCRRCQGGTVQCTQCSGRGEVRTSNGFRRCYHCDGGRAKCRDCRGRGEVPCDRCSGQGFVECSDCSGGGSIRCKPCSGQGGFDEFTQRVLSVFAGFSLAQHFHRVEPADDWTLAAPPNNSLAKTHSWVLPATSDAAQLGLPVQGMATFVASAIQALHSLRSEGDVLARVLGEAGAKAKGSAKASGRTSLSEALNVPGCFVSLTFQEKKKSGFRDLVVPCTFDAPPAFELTQSLLCLSEAREERITFRLNDRDYVVSRWVGARKAVEMPASFADDNLNAVERLVERLVSESPRERASAVSALSRLPDDSPFKGKVVRSAFKQLESLAADELAGRGQDVAASLFGARLESMGELAGADVTPASVAGMTFAGVEGVEAERSIRNAADTISGPVRSEASSKANFILIAYVLAALLFGVLFMAEAAPWLAFSCLVFLLCGPELLLDAQFKVHEAFARTPLVGWVGNSSRSHLFPRFWRTTTGIVVRILLLVGVGVFVVGEHVPAPASRTQENTESRDS